MQERDQRVLEQFSRGVIDMGIFKTDTNRILLNLVRVQSPGHKKHP